MKKISLALAVSGAILAQQAGAAGFIEDSKASLSLRNFYANQDTRSGSPANAYAEEWGQGFALNLQSGYTNGPVGFGVDALGLLGLRLDSGKGRHGGGLVFPSDGDRAAREFSSLGLTGKVKFSKTEARVGTLLPKLPVLVINDGRLLTQTFNGAQITTNEIDNLTLTAGKISEGKSRNSSNSEDLRTGGSTADSDGLNFAGGDYKVNKDLTLQYYYGNLEDYYKQHFAGLQHSLGLGAGALKTDLRYFTSDSDGKNSRADRTATRYTLGGDGNNGEVDNRTWSALFTYALGSHAFSLGYQKLSGDSNFPFVNQGGGATAYLITDSQIQKFLNAGERTVLASYNYDFGPAGVPGLKAWITYLKGDDFKKAGVSHEEWERDFRLDYTIQDGVFKGLGLSWRNAAFRSSAASDTDENRLILNYTLALR